MKKLTEREDWIFKRKIRDLVGSEYSVLGFYQGTHKKILFQHNCEQCGNYNFEMCPHEFIAGQRCPYCMKRVRKNHNDIIRETRLKFAGKITCLEEYKGPKVPILFRCNICGRKTRIAPYKLNEFVCFCHRSNEDKNEITRLFKENNLKIEENFKIKPVLIANGSSMKFCWFGMYDGVNIGIDWMDESHYKEIYGDSESFDEIKTWDKSKLEFCDLNDIFWIRIGFWNRDRLEEIIREISEFIIKYKINKRQFNLLKKRLNLGSYDEFKKNKNIRKK